MPLSMNQYRRRIGSLRLLAIAGLALPNAHSSAAIVNWVNSAGGNAATLTNWNPQVLPTAADTMNFNVVGGYVVNWGAGAPATVGGMSIGSSNVGLSITAPLTIVGACNVQTGSTVAGAALTVNSGELTVGHLTVGVAPTTLVDGQCSVNGSNSSIVVNSSYSLGGTNEGRMWVRSGATLESHCPVRIGVGQAGMLEVTGPASASADRSLLEIVGANNALRVGDGAQGDLNIIDGARAVVPGDAFAGPVPSVQGAITVSGSSGGFGSSLTIGGALYIGNNNASGSAGVGTLRVGPGATVTVAGQTTIGDAASASGLLDISGGTFLTHGLVGVASAGTIVHTNGTIIVDGGVHSRFTGGGIFNIAGTGDGAVLTLRNNAQWVLPAPGASATQVFLTAVGEGARFNLHTGSDMTHTGSEWRVGISGQRGVIEISDGSTLTTNAVVNMGGGSSAMSLSSGSSMSCGAMNLSGNNGDGSTLSLSGPGTILTASGLIRVGHNLAGGGGECAISITDGAVLTSTRIDPSSSIRFRQVNGAGGSLFMQGGTLNALDEVEYSNALTPLSMSASTLSTPQLSLNGSTLSGNGTINANILNAGQILPSGIGFAISGNLSDNGLGIAGSQLTFLPGSSYSGDGVLSCDILAQQGSSFTPSGLLTIGRLTSLTGVEFDGVMNITNTGIECFDSNGARLGGTVNLNNGVLTGVTGLRFTGGILPKLTGTGQINDDCFMNGRVEPGIASADPTGHLDFVTLTFGSAGSLVIDIEGESPGSFDTIASVDDLDLNNATLVVNRVGNYYPPRGTVYRIASGSTFGSTFGLVLGPGFHLEHGPNFVDLVFDGLCDSIDFNNDESFFDPVDIDAFLSVFSEGSCLPESATCNDIDFNNDGALFDPCDIESFLAVFSEGPCTVCGH
jgi:fibronectin-binding autotransporter adhesin